MSFKPYLKKFILQFSVFVLFALLILVIYLDSKVRHEFDQQAWAIPAKVYARPLQLSLGLKINLEDLIQELKLLGYRKVIKAVRSGDYERYKNTLVIYSRPFKFWDGAQPAHQIQLTITNGEIVALNDYSSDKTFNFIRLDPLYISSLQTNPNINQQDRQLVTLKELPVGFVSALLLTEDKAFYEHFGLSFKGVFRALWANLTSRSLQQGGSTLTQQLIKNHFLSREKSFWRKGNEAIMAILTELHYDKDTILQAYINEVYLGQNKGAAIHGFARASEFYFDRQLSKLNIAQSALLVAMVKGPSYYNPRRNPARAKKRRDLILRQMKESNLLDLQSYQQSINRSLMVVDKPPVNTSKVPAFLSLVKKELAEEYSSESLRHDGLRLFTTLDPIKQSKAEQALSKRLIELEKTYPKQRTKLQGAVLLADYQTGEIQAVVGDRNANYVGFNRAVDAVRQTGSIIKPFVYLAALSQPTQFNITTPIQDKTFTLTGSDGSHWQPQNYDKKEHGDANANVALGDALIHSYNLATARLAMKIGIDEVIDIIEACGFERPLEAYPSLALGAKEMSPLEVLGLYQVLANLGEAVKTSTLLAVQNQQGELLNRYLKKTKQVSETEAVFILRHLLEKVAQTGTARSLKWRLPNKRVAGKTGTTNDLRDSWFVGFDKRSLGVVWVGRDDNQSIGLTGAAAALPVWTDLFKTIDAESIQAIIPQGIEMDYRDEGFFSGFGDCKNKELKPFYRGEAPDNFNECELSDKVGTSSDKVD